MKGNWEEEEKCSRASPLTLTGISKGPRNLKKKGVMVEAESKNEEENAEKEEDNLRVDTQEEQILETQPEGNAHMFTEDVATNDRSPIDFTTPLASSPPIRSINFRETGESSRGASENNRIVEMLLSIQKGMEERDRK